MTIPSQNLLKSVQLQTPTSPALKISKIHDTDTPSNIGVVYWQQSTLEDIARLSGPLAASNEFQIHYWALVLRRTFDDGSIFDIALPTVIFNYEQYVTSAHIDFELKDVNDVSTALEPLHNVVVNQLLKDHTFNDCELISVPLNTMHRHPTGVSSFSSTDLKKDHETDTGIVFPLKTAKSTPSFSSIIYNDPVRLIHTEYRLATGDVDTDDGISYQKGLCLSYVSSSVSTPSAAQQALGFTPVDTSYVVNRDNLPDIQRVVTFLRGIHYTPNTQFVKEENVKKKVYQATSKHSYLMKPPSEKPAISGTYSESTKEAIVKVLKLQIRDLSELLSMPREKLIDHAYELESHYYEDDPTIRRSYYLQQTTTNLIDCIIDVQDLIIDDYLESESDDNAEEELELLDPSITRQDMIDMLLLCGVRYSDVHAASDEQIQKWYNEIM